MKFSIAPDTLKNLDEKTGKPPETRIKDAASARNIWGVLKRADDDADEDRSVVQQMFDGDPPYDPQDLKNLGQGYRCNVNFGGAAAMLEDSLTGYNDLTNSVDLMALVKLRGGDPQENAEWSRIVSEEFHALHHNDWPGFEFEKQLLAHYFVGQGVGVAYFDHSFDWRWRATSLQHFKMPRGIPADENKVEVAGCEREYQVHELWKFIRDPKAATAAGWNVKAVQAAILNAAQRKSEAGEWERLQNEFKDNDLGYGCSVAKTVSTVHVWNREFDGTLTFSIILRDSVAPGDSARPASGVLPTDDFLFRKIKAYKTSQDGYVIFTYGIGTNGLMHSIRGLGYKILDKEQINNRLQCQLVDSAFLSASLLVQPRTANDVVDSSIVYQGPMAVMPPGLNVLEKAYPNRVDMLLPVVNHISTMSMNNVGSYRVRGVDVQGQPITAREAEIREQKESTLSMGAMNLFYLPWKRLLNASARRLFAKGYRAEDPGGPEAIEFRKRCIGRGVPEEAFYSVYCVEPVRAVGYGSPTMRRIITNEVLGLAPQLPEQGRNNAVRDKLASLVGTSQVDRYLPKLEIVSAPPVDAKLAELENAHIQQGMQVSVRPGEQHAIHLEIHLPILAQFAEAARAGQQVDPSALPVILAMSAHVAGHIIPISPDESRRQLVGTAKKILQEVQELSINLGRQVSAMQRRAAEEQQAAAAQGPPQPQVDPVQMAKIQKMETDRQISVAKAQAELTVMQQKEAREKIKDDLAAAKMVGGAA